MIPLSRPELNSPIPSAQASAPAAPSPLSLPLRILGASAYVWGAWQISGLAEDARGAPFRDFFLGGARAVLNAPFQALAPGSTELLLSASTPIPTILELFDAPQLLAPRLIAFALSSAAIALPSLALVSLADRFFPRRDDPDSAPLPDKAPGEPLPLAKPEPGPESQAASPVNFKRRVLAPKAPPSL